MATGGCCGRGDDGGEVVTCVMCGRTRHRQCVEDVWSTEDSIWMCNACEGDGQATGSRMERSGTDEEMSGVRTRPGPSTGNVLEQSSDAEEQPPPPKVRRRTAGNRTLLSAANTRATRSRRGQENGGSSGTTAGHTELEPPPQPLAGPEPVMPTAAENAQDAEAAEQISSDGQATSQPDVAEAQQRPNGRGSAHTGQTSAQERRRQIARRRAHDFALGRGFVDDADTEREQGARNNGGANLGTDGHEQSTARPVRTDADGEVWPGPYTTAVDLLNKRSIAAAAREAKLVSQATKIEWQPRGSGSCLKKELPSLEELCLRKCVENIDYLLEEDMIIELSAPLLGRLSMELCKQRKFNAKVLPYFTEEGTPVLILPDCSYLSEDDLLSAFDTCKGPQLRRVHLKFCGRGMSDRVLVTLSTGSSNIRSLLLEGCYRLSDDGIVEAVNNLTDLSTLELTSCPNLGKRSIECFVNVLESSLTSLAIGSSPQLGPEELKMLSKLRNLESLKITENPNMTDEIVEEILRNRAGKVESLDFTNCTEITDEGVFSMAKHCPELKEIRLDYTKVSNKGLLSLATHCGFLQTVSLRSCSEVTDEGCLHLIKKCKLKSLSINGLYCITDATICSLAKYCSNSLQELDMSWCRAISDDALGVLIDSSRSSLKTVTLRGCSQISERVLGGHTHNQLEVLGHKLVEGIKAV